MCRIKISMLVACLAAFTLQGCGGAGQAKFRNDLKSFGLTYHIFHDENKKGPASWDELIAYAQKSGGDVASIQHVKDAGYQVTWGANLNNITGGTSNTVLAKPPGAGPTLMMDGSVK